MTTKILVAAISALALMGIATPALAQSGDFADRRIEELLRQLVTKQAAAATDPVLVTRAATIKVVGTVRRASAFRLPIACTIFVSDSEGHNEQKSGTVAFTGNVGTCTVVIPFRWLNTDKDGKVDVNAVVGNGPIDFLTTTAAVASNASRTSILDVSETPLPLQGSTTTVSFDILM